MAYSRRGYRPRTNRRLGGRVFRGNRQNNWVRRFVSAQNQAFSSGALNGNYVLTLADNPAAAKINNIMIKRLSINGVAYGAPAANVAGAYIAELVVGVAVDTADFRAAMQDPNARLLRKKFQFDNINGGMVHMWVPKGFNLSARPAFAGAVPLHVFVGANILGNLLTGNVPSNPRITLACTYEQLADPQADV